MSSAPEIAQGLAERGARPKKYNIFKKLRLARVMCLSRPAPPGKSEAR